MRPRGQARAALLASASALAVLGGAVTWRDMAAHAGVPERQARETAREMARAGELRVIGTRRVDGVNRPMRLYTVARPPRQLELFTIMAGWPTIQ